MLLNNIDVGVNFIKDLLNDLHDTAIRRRFKTYPPTRKLSIREAASHDVLLPEAAAIAPVSNIVVDN